MAPFQSDILLQSLLSLIDHPLWVFQNVLLQMFVCAHVCV